MVSLPVVRWRDMNYTELKAAIQGYTENVFPVTDLAGGGSYSSDEQLNQFIRQAEQRIYNSVQFAALRKTVTGTTTTANQFLACPLDFLASYSLSVTVGVGAAARVDFLLNKDTNFIQAAYPQAVYTGVPRFYSLYGAPTGSPTELTFLLGPTPDAAYPVQLTYFYYPESIVTAGTTWLGDNFDSVLLYGALVEAYTFMKGEADMLTLYDTKFKEALALAKRMGDGMQRQDAYRSGQSRMGVN